MYNVKVSEYLESTEVVYYDTPITGHEKEKDTILIERNDELYEVYSFIAFDVKEKKPKQDVNPYRSFYVSFNRTKNKIYNYARDNKWDWFITFTFDPPIPPGQARAANMEQVLENWMTELEGARRFGTLLNLQLDPQASGEQGRIFMLERLLAAMQDAGDVWIATGREIADYCLQHRKNESNGRR